MKECLVDEDAVVCTRTGDEEKLKRSALKKILCGADRRG